MQHKYEQAEVLRRALPYGAYIQRDAWVLFDRRYRPIAKLTRDRKVTRMPADAFVPHFARTWLYKDGTSPRVNRGTRRVCEAVLRRWGLDPAALRAEMLAEIRDEAAHQRPICVWRRW